jgi:DnaJ-domain-containing protein 1
MQLNQQCWCFAPSGAAHYAPEIRTRPALLGRTLRRVGAQIIVLAFILVDISGLGLALLASFWLAPWLAINVVVLVLGSLSWSENRRIHRESTTAVQRQARKVRAAEWRNLEEQQRKAQREHQYADWRQRCEEEEGEAQKRLHMALRHAQEQLREAEQRRQEEDELNARRREHAERLRQAEQQRREAEERRRQTEKEREAQRNRREHNWVVAQFKSDWWIVLGVGPTASKDEIVRKYRHKIKQCHPDRLVGLSPELLHLAEEQTKALNGAYENAMRTRTYAPRNGAAA